MTKASLQALVSSASFAESVAVACDLCRSLMATPLVERARLRFFGRQLVYVVNEIELPVIADGAAQFVRLAALSNSL